MNQMRQQSELFVKILGSNLQYYCLKDITQIGILIFNLFEEGLDHYKFKNQDHRIRRLFYGACESDNVPSNQEQAETILDLLLIFRATPPQYSIIKELKKQIIKAYLLLSQLDQYLMPMKYFDSLLICFEESDLQDQEEYIDCLTNFIKNLTCIENQYKYLKQYWASVKRKRITKHSFELSSAYKKSIYYILQFIQKYQPDHRKIRKYIIKFHKFISKRLIEDAKQLLRDLIIKAKQILNQFNKKINN